MRGGRDGEGVRERKCRQFARKWFPERFYKFSECSWSHLFSESLVIPLLLIDVTSSYFPENSIILTFLI